MDLVAIVDSTTMTDQKCCYGRKWAKYTVYLLITLPLD